MFSSPTRPPFSLVLLVAVALLPALAAAGAAADLDPRFCRSTDPGITPKDEFCALPFPGAVARLSLLATRDPEIFYAAGDQQLRRSSDGGRTWAVVNDTAQAPGTEPSVDPRNAAHLLAVDAYGQPIESDDAGWTWRRRAMLDEPIAATLFSRRHPGTVYYFGQQQVWRQREGQAQKLGSFPRANTGIVAAVETPAGSLIAAAKLPPGPFTSRTPLALLRSADAGASWQEVLRVGMIDADFALQPLDAGGSLFVGYRFDGTDGDELRLLRSLDDGLTWQTARVLRPGGTGESQGNVDLAADADRAERLWLTYAGQLWRSDDRGRNWSILDVAPSHRVTALAAAEGRVLVAADARSGGASSRFLTSGDGESFRDVGPNATFAGGALRRLVAGIEPDRLFALDGRGVFTSDDAGFRWHWLEGSQCASLLAPDPVEPGTFYLAGETHCEGQPIASLRRSRDGGATFEPIAPPTPFALKGLAAVRPAGGEVVLAAATDGSHLLFRSTDRGATWTTSDPPFTPYHLWVDGPRLYGSDYAGYLHRSIDGGATWISLGIAPGVPVAAFRDGRWASAYTNTVQLGGDDSAWSQLRSWASVDAIALDATGRLYLALGSAIYRTRDAGRTLEAVDLGLPEARIVSLLVDPFDDRRVFAGTETGLWSGRFGESPPLSLGQGRFAATLSWRDAQGHQGLGHPEQITGDTGAFRLFDDARAEVAVKLLDGRSYNGHFWVFVASMTHVEFHLEVLDTVTGESRTYDNPAGELASFGDTLAFPLAGAQPSGGPAANSLGLTLPYATPTVELGGRFAVSVEWRDPVGGQGAGLGLPTAAETASFYFFSPDNVELFVNVIDGRPLNGKFWVFLSGLSNVGYTVRVEDRQTGQVRLYEKPVGAFGSQADTDAF